MTHSERDTGSFPGVVLMLLGQQFREVFQKNKLYFGVGELLAQK